MVTCRRRVARWVSTADLSDMCPDVCLYRYHAPAASIPSKFWIVPKFTSSAPAALLRSGISSGAVAMMGDAPSASVALADCVVTTLFVI